MNAAVTLSLSGPFARQGLDAAQGLTLWAEETGVRLTVVDDGGSRRAAIRAYGGWLDAGVELLLGPYSGGLVRAVAPLVCGAGRPLWNHGGSADDLARPGLVSLPAPASTYFHGAVDEAAARRVDRLLVARGAGPFARAVAAGRGGGGPAGLRRARGGGGRRARAGAMVADLADAAGRAVGSRLRRRLPAPGRARALLRGRAGGGRRLSRACRPRPGPGGGGPAGVADLDPARRLRPRRVLAPGRPPRDHDPVAGWPHGPARPPARRARRLGLI